MDRSTSISTEYTVLLYHVTEHECSGTVRAKQAFLLDRGSVPALVVILVTGYLVPATEINNNTMTLRPCPPHHEIRYI